MAIDHLKVNNVFELGKDEGADFKTYTDIGLVSVLYKSSKYHCVNVLKSVDRIRFEHS